MNDKYNEVYNYLSCIDKLGKSDYQKLIAVYGTNLVHSIIEQKIDENENNIHKFGCYVEEITLDQNVFSDVTALNAYMNDLGKLPCLTEEENRKLTSEVYEIITSLRTIFGYFDCKYVRQRGILYNSISEEVAFYLNECKDPELYDLINQLHEKFIVVRNQLVEGNIRLVVSVMKPFYRSADFFVEVLQCGNIGLMRAVEKYNPKYGTSFSTYAYYWIKQAYRSTLKFDLHTGVDVSYKQMENNASRLKAIDKLTAELGRNPTRDEIAKRMGISIKKLDEIESALCFDVSLFSKVSVSLDESGDTDLIDMCESNDVNIENEICFKELKPELMSLLDECLNERQKFIILNRFGFSGEIKTFEELSHILRISRQRVEQEQTKSLVKMRRKAKSSLLEFLQ